VLLRPVGSFLVLVSMASETQDSARTLTLLIANKMLCARHNARLLNALDRCGHTNTCQDRIRREALPIATRLGHPTQGSGNGPQQDCDTFCIRLPAHGQASLEDESLVKGSGCCLARGKCRVVVSSPNPKRAVVEAKFREPESRDSAGLANTLLGFPAAEESTSGGRAWSRMELTRHPWSS
jgi:hypothetical protein